MKSKRHYDLQAYKFKKKKESTIFDIFTRDFESKFILFNIPQKKNIRILDLGCGNGYTLGFLKKKGYLNLTGVEKNKKLFELAKQQQIRIYNADFLNFNDNYKYDVIISQRFLINLNYKDQKLAIKKIYKLLKNSGKLISIEANLKKFQKINQIRKLFGLKHIKIRKFNFFLKNNIFNKAFINKANDFDKSQIDKHYFVTRVLHPIFLKNKKLKYNSKFIKDMNQIICKVNLPMSYLEFYNLRKII